MRFVYPLMLWSLCLLPVLLLGYIGVQMAINRKLASAGDQELVRRMVGTRDLRLRTVKFLLRLGVLFFLILAVARPQYGLKNVPVTRKGIDVVVALDTSKSMLAEDIKPSRLEKSKHELRSFIELLKGDRTGIVLFAGKAFIQCPLTIDYEAAKSFIEVIDTQSVPVPGTNLAEAIRTALLIFDNRERKHKAILLLSDGEDQDNQALNLAKKAAEAGVVIYTVGIGNSTGEPIPVLDENGNRVGYKKDQDGKIIVSRLNEELLRQIAQQTEGAYYHATPAEYELDSIYKEIRALGSKEIHSRLVQQYQDRFQYPLFLAMLLLLADLLLLEGKRRTVK